MIRKVEPVFRKDHAQTTNDMQRDGLIALYVSFLTEAVGIVAKPRLVRP
jgi:hypothetical protein